MVPLTIEHLKEHGLSAEAFEGIHGPSWKLFTKHVYEVDVPNSDYHIGPSHLGIHLSHYMLWRTLQYLPEEEFLVCEDDVVLRPYFQERFKKVLEDLPPDWDMVWIGSCCAQGKPKEHIKGDVYVVKWPFCTHCYMVRNRVLKTLHDKIDFAWAPLDLQFGFDIFPHIKVYTVLPRLVDQYKTTIAD